MQQVNAKYCLLPTGVENGNDLIAKTAEVKAMIDGWK